MNNTVQARARRMLSKAKRLRATAVDERRRAESMVASASANEAEAAALCHAADLLAKEFGFDLATPRKRRAAKKEPRP